MTAPAPAWYSGRHEEPHQTMVPRMVPPRRAAWVIGAANVTTAALLAFAVFVGLPARWWPVDTAAATVVLLELGAAVALFARAPWALTLARTSAAVALALGLTAVTLLAVTASWLSGVYGPVGRGGAIVLGLVAALILPYLVVLPAAQLVWLGPGDGAGPGPPFGGGAPKDELGNKPGAGPGRP